MVKVDLPTSDQYLQTNSQQVAEKWTNFALFLRVIIDNCFFNANNKSDVSLGSLKDDFRPYISNL